MARYVKKSTLKKANNVDEKILLVQKLIEEEAPYYLEHHSVKFSYETYDGYTGLIILWEEDDSPQPLTRKILKPLQERMQKEIDPKFTFGIKFRTIYID